MPLIYNIRLQELAQRKKWSSPIYSHVQEGPSHMPRFKATVTVEGKRFESSEFFSTLPEAEDSAAKVAFASFPDEGIPEEKAIHFKNLLQELAHKKGVCLPAYTTIKSGSSHSPTFQSTVEIDGEMFSGKTAATKKNAEASAAKVALSTFKEQEKSYKGSVLSTALHAVEHSGVKGAFTSDSDEETQEENSLPPQNILQELSQKKGRPLPVYTTVKSGISNFPTFQSTVQIDGETFSGKAAKRKKQAEANAAKVALSTLKERGLVVPFPSPNLSCKKNNLKIRSSPMGGTKIEKGTIVIHDKQFRNVSSHHSLEEGTSGLEPQRGTAVPSSLAVDMYANLQQQFISDGSFSDAGESSKSPLGQSELSAMNSPGLSHSNYLKHALSITSAGISKQRKKVIVFPRWEQMNLPVDGSTQPEVNNEKWVAVTRVDSGHDSK